MIGFWRGVGGLGGGLGGWADPSPAVMRGEFKSWMGILITV